MQVVTLRNKYVLIRLNKVVLSASVVTVRRSSMIIASVTLNWRLIRPLLLLFCATLFLCYFYTTFLPPKSIYNQLFDAEVRDSKSLIRNERGYKYVKFRQLQGAGFNNQVNPSL